MAIEIDFGRELGRVAFPDDVTDEQAQSYVRENYQAIRQGLIGRRQEELAAETEREEKAKFQLGQYDTVETMLNTLSELPRGALEGIGLTLKAAARLPDAIPTFAGGTYDPYTEAPIEQVPLFRAGQAVQEFGKETYPGLPGVRETVPAQVMGGIGSTVATLPAAVIAGPVGAAPLGAAISYGLQSGESAAEEADTTINRRIAEAMASRQYDVAADLQDRREQMKNLAFITTAPIGAATEFFLGAAPKVARRFVTGRIGGIGERIAESLVPKSAKYQRKFLGVTGAERVRGAVEALATEGVQESAEQLGGNIAAAAVYDPERGWLDGVAQAGFVGSLSGGIVGGLVGSRRNAKLAGAANEALGGDPTNPLPRANATVAGLEDTQQEGEPEITAEDVMRKSQEAGLAGQEEEVIPASKPQPKSKAAPVTPEVDIVRLDDLRKKANTGTINPDELAELTLMHQTMGIPDPVVAATPATPTTTTTPAAATVDAETGLDSDEQDELDQLITAEDAGLLSEDDALTLAAYRARLGGVNAVVTPVAPTPAPVATPVVRTPAPTPTPAPVVTTSAKLPEDLAKAKPRYSFSRDTYVPAFDSDFDLAAYIVTQATPSLRDADYLNWAVEASGMTPEEVRKHGLQVRAQIKQLSRQTKGGTSQKPATLVVPSVRITMPEVKVTATPVSVPVAKPVAKPASATKPAEELTEKQYYDQRVKEIADANSIGQSEVRDLFSQEDANLEYWQLIQKAAESGKQFKSQSLDRLPQARVEFLRRNFPQSIPQGYFYPGVVKTIAPAPTYTPARINKLLQSLKARATAVGKGLYEIKKLAPGQRLVLRTSSGRLQETDQFLLREKSEVTGNVYDEGFILRDKQEYAAGQAPKPAPTEVAPAEPVAAEPTEAELQAAEEARLAQAEQEIDAGPIGQAKQKLEDEGSDMKKSQVKAMARKLEKAGVIDDSELDDEGRDTEVDELVGQLLERIEEARDNAIQEREQELADEAKVEKVAPKPAPISKVAQIISKLENLKVDTGGTFDAVLGVPALIWNGALITAQNALRAGKAVTEAIDAAIEYIRTSLNEKQAARVNLDAVREQFETDLVLGRSVSEIIDDGKLSGYKQKARHLIPEERRKLRSDTKKRFVDLFNQLPSVSEFAAAALGGAVKRGWYRKSAEALIDVFGVDAPRFAALLAGLSPQTSVENNLVNALNVWKNWNLAGRPTDRAAIVSVMGRSVQGNKGEQSVLDAWINNSVRALSSEDPTSITLSGPKVNSFMLNLRGVVNEVTNDAWMANFALVDQAMFAGSLNAAGTDPGKGTGYLAMSAKVRATAEYLTKLTGDQWTPAEVQETVWSWAKTLYELQDRRGETRNAVEILRAGDLTEEAIAGTPDFATLLADGEYRRILAEAGYGNQVEQLARRSAELRGAQRPLSASQAAAAASQTLRNAEERAARRLVQLREQRAAEAEAERNQRPDRVEAILKKVIAATDPKGKVFEAVAGLSNFVIYQASKIALRIYQATKSWVAARNAGMDYIKSHVQLSNEAETAANFEEHIKAFPNQEIPAGTPERPQPPSPDVRVPSRGLFLGDISTDTDENWASEAKKWVDFYKGNLERAFQVALTADIDNAFKEYILGEIIQRNQLDIARAKGDVEVMRALNLEKRLADSAKSLGAVTAKAMAARKLAQERFWWAQPAMILRNLIRKRQDELIPFSKIESEQVRKWLSESGREAVNQIREAMKKADAVFAREFRKIKQVPGEADGPPIEIKWQDILTQALDTQGSVRQKMLQIILADPRLRNLSPAGIAEITNLLTSAWETKRNQIFRAEFQKKVPLPNVKPDVREKLFRSLPRILKYANIARATPGSFSIQDGPDTYLLWEQAFRDAVAPEFGVAELNGITARKITDLAQKAQAQSGVNRNEIIQQMFRLMAREGGVRFSDVLRDYWYAAVLSGIRTQVDNAMNVFNGFLNTAMFATMAKKDAGFIAYSALKGLDEGIRDFWPMLWRGELYRSVNFNPDQPGSALEGLGESRNLFAKGISQFKYVGRLINALDHMTALMSDSTAKAYALRKLYDADVARQYLTPSPEVVAVARARAIAEGTRPELVNKRTREIIQEKLPVDVLMTSREIREMTTFTETPQGLLGSLYRGLDQAAQGKTLYKVLSGTNFLRFAANSANEILNFALPVALYRWYQSAPGKSEGEYGLKFSESRRDLILAKATFGTVLGIFAGALFLGDDDKEEDRNMDITGSFKSLDPNKRKQLLSEGRQPYSIRFGNTYVSYRQMGFGGVLATIGELRDRQLFSPDKWSQENIIDKVLDGAAAGMFIVKDSTAISGLTELLGFANAYKYDTDEFIEKSFPRYVSRLAGSLVPNILKEVDAWSDPSIFKTEAGNLGYEYFLQQVPFGRREIGPGPILNVLGEPVKVERYPWSRWAKEREVDPAWSTLGSLASKGVFMPTPAITVKVNENGTRRELTREEKYQYQQAVGQGYRKFIEQNSERLLALPPAQASDLIDKNADRIRRNARTNLKNSF